MNSFRITILALAAIMAITLLGSPVQAQTSYPNMLSIELSDALASQTGADSDVAGYIRGLAANSARIVGWQPMSEGSRGPFTLKVTGLMPQEYQNSFWSSSSYFSLSSQRGTYRVSVNLELVGPGGQSLYNSAGLTRPGSTTTQASVYSSGRYGSSGSSESSFGYGSTYADALREFFNRLRLPGPPSVSLAPVTQASLPAMPTVYTTSGQPTVTLRPGESYQAPAPNLTINNIGNGRVIVRGTPGTRFTLVCRESGDSATIAISEEGWHKLKNGRTAWSTWDIWVEGETQPRPPLLVPPMR